jgi:hypothetical protein
MLADLLQLERLLGPRMAIVIPARLHLARSGNKINGAGLSRIAGGLPRLVALERLDLQ